MKRNILQTILTVILAGGFFPAVYSQPQPENFKVSSHRIAKGGNQVYVSIDLDLDEMKVKSNEMVILTPILQSNEPDGDSLFLPPIAITGGVRNKIVNRKQNLGNHDQLPFETKPQTILKRKNNTSQSVNYNTSVAYRPWMDNASLTIQKIVSGCANCYDRTEDQLIVQNILPKRDPATYRLTFIMPEAEPVKARSDRHTATFNYHVDRYELLRDYRNNGDQFEEVDRIIGEIRDNSDLDITEFTIVGYASPEGSFEHNRILAQNRANSFAHYLVSKFSVSRDKFSVEGKGEDWEGLRKAISVSFLADKQNILNIIDKVRNPDARDADLLKLSDGDTYKTLLNNYYPLLRRTEYTVAYEVRAFNVEEAKQIIKKNPKLLSLNEMYLVAESYPSNSKEFREVFDIAVRLYPESEIAIVNSAGADIESKNYDAAIERLKRIEDKPIAWNNLGVAYMLKGDTKKAKEYFEKSANRGDKDAKANLEILQIVDQDN
ncbi:DUF3868 domain-containing protein [Dysgonomonas gadei]|uniref:OmpA-like domain-containing protein n=1 Tax=Dysgonomonas gadei ATCC BAA-286 TaxID=742766 RepID=F5IV92_9BACT|nr:DUF3868 domain-containing protein [Dysgonomonas gadei]EGK02542.1 hypothetical protein HMPREF9455_00792 [Dysgonomonas gadei ATCC BAA-286]